MLHLVINILWFLVLICVLVGLYWVVIWVFGQLGVPLPAMAVKIIFIIIALICLIYLITILAGGGGFPSMGRLGMAVLPLTG